MKVKYKVYQFGKDWFVEYICDGYTDKDVRGTYGIGIKSFPTKKQAEASGKRYVKKMIANGFEGYKEEEDDYQQRNLSGMERSADLAR